MSFSIVVSLPIFFSFSTKLSVKTSKYIDKVSKNDESAEIDEYSPNIYAIEILKHRVRV